MGALLYGGPLGWALFLFYGVCKGIMTWYGYKSFTANPMKGEPKELYGRMVRNATEAFADNRLTAQEAFLTEDEKIAIIRRNV